MQKFLVPGDNKNDKSQLTSPFIEVNVSNVDRVTFCQLATGICAAISVLFLRIGVAGGETVGAVISCLIMIDIQVVS